MDGWSQSGDVESGKGSGGRGDDKVGKSLHKEGGVPED